MPNSPQHRDAETVVESINVNINSKRPEVSLAEPAIDDPVLAPYHRTMEEIEKMPVIERTDDSLPRMQADSRRHDLQGRGERDDKEVLPGARVDR